MLASVRARQLKPSFGISFANSIISARVHHQSFFPMHDGELDLPPDPSVIAATQRALSDGKTRYDQVKGLSLLREGICEKLAREDGVAADPDEILVGNGSSQIIFEVFQTCVSPGDRVLIPCPSWPTYDQAIRLAGGTPVSYPCLDADIDLDLISRLADDGVKILVINSPHNPTGTVLSRRTIESLISLADEHDMLVLSDEAYDGLTDDEVERVNPIMISGTHKARILTTRSFSKVYSMTGFRIGYLYASRETVDRCAMLQAHLSDNVCTFAQFGALAALRLPDEFINVRATMLQKRLETVHSVVSRILPCAKPRGGFYLFPSIEPVLNNGWETADHFVESLLQREGVAALPGDAFGLGNHIRLSVAALDERALFQAMEKFSDFCSKSNG